MNTELTLDELMVHHWYMGISAEDLLDIFSRYGVEFTKEQIGAAVESYEYEWHYYHYPDNTEE